MSNGKIEMAGAVPFKFYPDEIFPFYFYRWLVPVRFENPSYHQGESFLLLTRDEWELARLDGRPFTQLKPDYEDGNFIVIRYPSAEIIHREVLDNP